MRFLLVEAAQVAVRSQPQWRSRFFHLAMRRGGKIAKVAMARKLAVAPGLGLLYFIRAPLLSRHHSAHRRFFVLNKISADVDNDVMNDSGEGERRRILRRDAGAGVTAALQSFRYAD